jgi:hypothetical protein
MIEMYPSHILHFHTWGKRQLDPSYLGSAYGCKSREYVVQHITSWQLQFVVVHLIEIEKSRVP